MAHMIHLDKKSGTHSFVSNTEKAWHGLGQIVDKAMTAQEAIKLANLDYEVEKTTVHAKVGDEYPEFPDKFFTYRTDTNTPLGIVGGRYEIIQNRDAFGFFDSIIDSGEAIFETAGVLGRGERIFVTAKLPEDMMVHGEPCNKYIILTNSHDGSSSVIAGFTTIRVVCNNTLQAAMRDLTNKVSISHTAGAKERIEEAHKLMGIASKYMTEVNEVFNKMAKTTITDENLKKFIFDVMKPEYFKDEAKIDEELSTRMTNLVTNIHNFALSHHTQQTDATRGTVFGAYNSISGYYSYIHRFRNQEQKFESQLFGTANRKIQKGFEKALELSYAS